MGSKLPKLNLRAMAVRMIRENAAHDIVTAPQVVTQEEYLRRVEEHLRAERMALVDSAFRSKYGLFLA